MIPDLTAALLGDLQILPLIVADRTRRYALLTTIAFTAAGSLLLLVGLVSLALAHFGKRN